MMHLDHSQASVLLNGRRQPPVTLQQRIRVDAELAGKPLTDSLDMRSAGHRESKPPTRSLCQPVKLILTQSAVLVALAVGEWCQHEAIPHGEPTVEAQGVGRGYGGVRCHGVLGFETSMSELAGGCLAAGVGRS